MRHSDSEMWKSWDKGGNVAFIKDVSRCVDVLKRDADPTECEDVQLALDKLDLEIKTKGLIYDLIKAGVTGVIRKEKVSSALNEVSTLHSCGAVMVADAVTAVDEELNSRQASRDKFLQIVRGLDSNLNALLLERINIESVPDFGLVSNKKSFNTKFIRLKTKLYFKQRKYNLFREESEGYGKIISELSPPFTNKCPEVTTRAVMCLIGRFTLDPNRILDIILDTFEIYPVCSFFIPLLKKMCPSSSTICELLGFKLQNLEAPNNSIFTQIALLLQHKVIELDEMYSWLTPDDRFIQKEWEEEVQEAKEYARRSMIVMINKDKEEEASPIEDKYTDNQKFSLCEALLDVGDWDHVEEIMTRLPPFALLSRKPIALKFINLVHYLIDPLYKKVRSINPSLGWYPNPTLFNSEKAPKQVDSYSQFSQCLDIIIHIGPYLYYDPILLYKLLRVMRHYVKHAGSSRKPLYFKFLSLFDEVILPAVSFLDANCPITEELWSVLKHYPYHHRYRLYCSWKGETLLHCHPGLLRRRVDLVKKIKHLMRRISKENVKPMGRQLGKLAHSMPAVVFDYILSQVQLFDNLINPIIDALKFLTTLCYDVLAFCLLEALSPNNNTMSMSLMLMPNRPRTKHDGSTIASWLQNLSSFTGAMCKKYNIELVPILQYVANQLKAKQGLDLLLLKEVVQKMTGVEAAEEMTSEQLDAMAGGEMLRCEAGYFGQIRSAKKSGARLREAVSVNDLAITLCILMAQQRNCIVFDDAQDLHSKLVGKLYDQCQDTLVQFGTFLANSCTMDDYSKKIPSLDKLVKDYHVSPDVAFFLWRPIFASMIGSKYDELRRAEKNHKALPVSARQQKYAEACNHVFGPVAEVMRMFFAPKIWDDISPQFYVTFWSLSLYDLHVPSESYLREISRIKQTSNAIADNKDLPSSKRKKEQERCLALIEKLQEEERRQREHVDRVMAKLDQEKDIWFASRIAKSAKNEAVTAFLQHCLFPRCIFTAPDALYCAYFVNIIHSLQTPNFSTLICYDRIFCDIIYTVTSCTENEANRYGRFLCALLETVMKWHGDKAIFDKECASYPGFVTKFRAANATMTESSDHVDYENFRHVCHKWHYKITKCIITCLESKDFIQIRNALIVLKRILPYYPKVANLAAAVERWIERVRGEEKDKRQDLFALATSYIGQLKGKWNTLVLEEDFHHKPPEKQEKQKKPAAPKEKKKVITKTDGASGTNSPVVNHVNSNAKILNGSTVSSPTLVAKKEISDATIVPPAPTKISKDVEPKALPKKELKPVPEEKIKEKSKRVKTRDTTSNGSAASSPTNSGVTSNATPVTSAHNDSSQVSDEKEKKREKKKMERKREREVLSSPATPETKRKRTEKTHSKSKTNAFHR